MTPREEAQVRLATMRLDNDPNAEAMRRFLDLCDLLNRYNMVKIDFTINRNRRINRVMSTDQKGTASIATQDFFAWKPLLHVLEVLMHKEIMGSTRFRITPSRYAMDRVAATGYARAEEAMSNRAEAVTEMQEHDPITIL